MPFGITRSWSNGGGYDNGTDLGFGWNINQLPTVVQVNGTNTLSIVIDGNQARTFDVTTTATVYKERFFGQHQLTHEYEFDVVGRPIADIASTLGSGIDDAVAVMTTEYDSAGRTYRFSSWTITGYLSQEGPVNQVVREFNGFGQVTREYQEFEGAVDEETLYVEYGYSDSGNQSLLESMNYPNNQGYDPELAITYDAIGRPISQSYFGFDELESVSYLGLGRIIGSQVGDGALTETQTLDRFGRIIELLWEDDTPAAVDNFTYGYDRDGNILYRTNELNHGA